MFDPFRFDRAHRLDPDSELPRDFPLEDTKTFPPCGQEGAVGVPPGGRGEQGPVCLPGHVALQAPHRLALGLALGHAPRDVPAGPLVAAHPADRYAVKRPVGPAVPAPVEPVPGRSPARRLDRARSAEHGEGGLGTHAPGVVAGRDAQLHGAQRTAPLDPGHRWRAVADHRLHARPRLRGSRLRVQPCRCEGRERGEQGVGQHVAGGRPPPFQRLHQVPAAESRVSRPDRFRRRADQGLRSVHGLRLRPHEDLPGAERGPRGLGPAVPRLRDRDAVARRHRACRPLRVDEVVLLRPAAPPVALRPEGLPHPEALCDKMGRRPRPEQAGALDADGDAVRRVSDGAGELAVAPGRRRERCGADLPPEGVEDAQDVGVLVRVDPREDRDRDGFHAHRPAPRRSGHAGRAAGHNTDGGAGCSCRGPFRAHAPMGSWPAPDARGGARQVIPRSIPLRDDGWRMGQGAAASTIRRSARFRSIVSGKRRAPSL